MQYWIHRISHHIELSEPLLLEHQLLSIGWSFFADRGFINEHQNNWQRVPQTVEQRYGKVKPRFSLQRFLEMERGDRVVVPRPYVFHVYEIEADERLIPVDINVSDLKNWHGKSVKINKNNGLFYEEGEDKPIDLGFFRRVKLIVNDVPRASYADNALTKRMKVRQTNVEINDLEKSVAEAIRAFGEENPINPHGLIVEACADKVLEVIRTKLDSDRFEKLIDWYFQKMGAKTDILAKHKKGGQEGDADVVATFEAIKTIIYVQAKLHEGKTNERAANQIKGHIESSEAMGVDDGYSKIAWVVSTANEFDDQCKKLAEENKIHLINGKEFATMLLEAGISSLEELA